MELSVFPGLLLILTLFRLSLNVASTRLILSQADAGRLIEAFGDIVVRGNYIIGFIIFVIVIIIQFVVITKGSGRVAEVAARFTLDAMPGKQMAIDADLNAGLIDEGEARRRREEITREADFYGSMDGASKFVRGDAVAGILITLINIIGGFAIGVLQRDMTLSESMSVYTLLTVNDGLVTQIPALITSTAAGIIVTRADSDQSLGADINKQLTG
jgi:flagellar biosynthesis protein FlhA